MTLESSKNLGGIGAILLFISLILVPFGQLFLGLAIGLVGLILVLVGLNGLANYYSERGIVNNAIYGLVAGIVGGIIAGIVAFVAIIGNINDLISALYPGWNGDWSSLQGMTPNTSINPADILPFIIGVLLAFVVVWIFAIIVAFFTRRSLKLLSAKSSIGLFSTAGLLLIIGAALTIVLIGFLLMWIAVLLIAIAFFTMKPAEPPAPTAATQAPPAPTPV